MAVQVAVPSTRRVNHRVDQCCYAADVGTDGLTTVDIPPCAAAGAVTVSNGIVIAAAGNVTPVGVQTEFIMSRYGRQIAIAGLAGATGNATLVGFDYLGQGIKETLALAGVTPVLSKKMFKDVAFLTVPIASTYTFGVGPILGVPYKVLHTQILGELTSDAPATAGALVAGVSAQTLTSGDPRGTYTPNAAPDGIRYYRFSCYVDRSNLHGSMHAYS
jgi:hypothetical protein